MQLPWEKDRPLDIDVEVGAKWLLQPPPSPMEFTVRHVGLGRFRVIPDHGMAMNIAPGDSCELILTVDSVFSDEEAPVGSEVIKIRFNAMPTTVRQRIQWRWRRFVRSLPQRSNLPLEQEGEDNSSEPEAEPPRARF